MQVLAHLSVQACDWWWGYSSLIVGFATAPGEHPPTLKTHPEMPSKASQAMPAASDSDFYLEASQSIVVG